MRLYTGIHSHSNSNYGGIIDEENKRIYMRQLPDDLGHVLKALEPFKQGTQGVVAGSAINNNDGSNGEFGETTTERRKLP